VSESSGHIVDESTQQPAPADLARIERDLAGVETALQRLDAGTYWTDEVTGDTIPDEVLMVDPVTRRAG
jgi:RNA polymerase-binding transcription factor DksA